jgi:DNA-binding NarL/FixJ family response regulator
MIRLLCVDDFKLLLNGIGRLLREAGDLELVGRCSVAEQVIPMALETKPDIVLMNLIMPRTRGGNVELCGFEETRKLVDDLPGVRVVIFTFQLGPHLIEMAKEAGAAACIHKGTDWQDVLWAIRTVAAGGDYWDERINT